MVERVTYLGFEVRVELALTGGGTVWAQVTRSRPSSSSSSRARSSGLARGTPRSFENGGGPQTAELTLSSA